jgi:hypothetical protein
MRAHLLRLVFVASPFLGCGDPNEPPTYNLRVSVYTVGADSDSSYTVHAGDRPGHPIRALALLSLSPGEHDVVLADIASNCTVQGQDSVRVTITPGELAAAAFQVECRATTGAIEIFPLTAGRDFDSDGYTVQVDDVVRTRAYSGIPAVIEGVAPGSHVVTLGDFSANCSLVGSPTQTVLVTAGGLTRDTVRATFEGSCQATTGDVRLITTTEGADQDRDGYTVTLDGELVVASCGWYDYYCEPGTPFMFAPNGDQFFYLVPPGDHTYQLGDIASNCAVPEGESRTLTVEVGDTSVVRFDVVCETS